MCKRLVLNLKFREICSYRKLNFYFMRQNVILSSISASMFKKPHLTKFLAKGSYFFLNCFLFSSFVYVSEFVSFFLSYFLLFHCQEIGKYIHYSVKNQIKKILLTFYFKFYFFKAAKIYKKCNNYVNTDRVKHSFKQVLLTLLHPSPILQYLPSNGKSV